MINKVEMQEAGESRSSHLGEEIGKSKKILQDNGLLLDHWGGTE